MKNHNENDGGILDGDMDRCESINDGVHLLISILVCYPQIVAVKFVPDNKTLRFTVMLKPDLNCDRLQLISQKMRQSLDVYHWIEHSTDYLFYTEEKVDEKINLFTICRDVETLNKKEIELIISILQDIANEFLIRDDEHSLMAEELQAQAEVLENMLRNLGKQIKIPALFGVREDGRVMVFDK